MLCRKQCFNKTKQKKKKMENSNDEWISVSAMAERLGKTKQTVYNYISEGRYKTKEFTRGSMRGLLVCVPTNKKCDESV